VLVPNAPLGTQGWISGNAQEGWGILDGNTNRNLLLSGLIISYLQNDTSVFKCPADVVPSLNGQRLRSYSMNGQMGESGFNEDPPAVLYYKGSDITCPTPANAFVFCDENPGSINDGYLQVNTQQGSFPDVPAAYHGTACGFSFADGHAEIHLWQTSTLDVPIISGRTYAEIGTSISNVDWVWFSQHTACNHY
jgi:prepilin-type processing-associated H-X9-DG protein